MAEAVAISLASKAVTSIADPAFKKAYETVCSIWGAKKELDAITDTIKVIERVLQEAEKQRDPAGSGAVKVLIERKKEVMYDAYDLFDEVATNDLIKKQMEGMWKQVLKEVRVFFSMQNQVVSNYSIVKKVKSIRKKLDQIKEDRALAGIVPRVEHSTSSTKGESWSFVDPKDVFGRDDDKAAILEFLFDKEYADKDISLISIVGIGGMGKTSLAQLVYQDRKILDGFNEDRRWWACISKIDDPRLVAEKIFHAITGSSEQGLSTEQLKIKIRKCVDNQEKFFLVLDDLWEDEKSRGHDLLSLLRSDSAKGSKIMITTRSSSVSKAMNVDKTHELKGLANDASWELFKMFAFSEEPEKDSNWEILGKKIMKKCANVPLAIRSIASALHTKDTLEEWEEFEGEELSAIEENNGSISIMSALRVSYHYLPSNLKQCFAYCSLFEKDSRLYKKELINLWMAQGYVHPSKGGSLEVKGHSYFMELFRKCFFCEVKEDSNGDIESCKMHELLHDLAQEVAGTGILVMKEQELSSIPKETRHVSVGCKVDESWSIPPPLLKADRRIRSFLFLPQNVPRHLVLLDRQVVKFRFLRALNLGRLNIKVVPSSIGKLKFMRYLNLSRNKELEGLPSSITKLVNLQTLDLSGCLGLKVLPNKFRKLISLRHLDISGCESLRHMPSRFGELTSLQYLSDFKVGKGGAADDGEDGGLVALVGLKLQGQLRIFYDKEGGWLEDEIMLQHGQIPEGINGLSIHDLPNARIPVWWKEDSNSLQLKLTSIRLERCKRVRHLPSFRRLPNLRDLVLDEFEELEYLEEEEVVSNAPFFPSLEFLELTDLPKLEGWSRRCKAVTTTNEEHSIQNPEQPSFPKLSRLCIHSCYSLKSLPLSPHLHQLWMLNPTQEMVQQLVSTSSSSLRSITIQALENVKSFRGEGLTSVRRLELRGWPALENVQLPSDAGVEELTILRCRNLMLWNHGEEKTGVDWGQLPSLRALGLDQIPESQELPNCLGQRVEQGLLQIKMKK